MLLSELSGHYFYLTDHLLNHPMVHLRLSQVLEHTWRMTTLRTSDSGHRWRDKAFRHFVLYKCILYGWIACWTEARLAIVAYYALTGRPFDQLPERSIRIFLTRLVTFPMGPLPCLLIMLAFIYPFFVDYNMTVQMHPLVLELLHSMVVTNQRGIAQLNPKLFPLIVIDPLHPIETSTKVITWLRTLWACEKANFAVPVMRHFENHSPIVRVRYIVLTTAMDLVSVLYNLILIFFLISMLSMAMFVFRLDLVHYPPLLLDGILLVFVLWNAIRMTFFTIEIMADTAFGYRWLFRRALNPILSSSIDRYQVRPNASNLKRLLFTLDRFRREHTRVSAVSRLTNQSTVSGAMLVTMATNLGANVMVVTFLFYLHLSTGEIVILGMVIVSQTCLSLCACHLLILWVDSLHCSDRLLLNASQALRIDQVDSNHMWLDIVRAKIKLATFYELIHARKRFHFTVGPLAKITRHSLLEFLFIYSGYLFFAFMFIRNNLNKVNFI